MAALVLIPFPAQVSAAPSDAALDIQDGVTLHCWNWSFTEIEEHMEIIASLGYTAIQTSPIQQAKQATDGYPTNDWWVYYQPMGFHIDNSGNSALGTKADFESMCQTAHKYGIKVIVDVVANHMGNTESGGNGLASTIIDDLRSDNSCWHDITKNTNNYSNRYDVTQYCMAGLPDLNTANEKVQTYVLNFLKECIDAGADGFRFDAAKHIETPDDGDIASNFWPTVIDGAKSYAQSSRGLELYCYGELLDSPGGNLSASSYTKYMSVTDNAWSNNVLSNVVGKGNASSFSASYYKGDASQLVLWAESHDTYADGSTMDVSEENINKAWALIGARTDAMSLYLARPANMSQLLGAASDTAWSFPEVAAVNESHNLFVGQTEYVASENGVAYVERGTSGVVLVNCKGTQADISVTANKIADGTYTDQITGNTFTVAGGKISGTIGSTGIAVVYDADPCDHTTHNTDGFCTDCHANVGHTYDENNTCACGDVKVNNRTIYFVNTGKWNTVNFYSWYNDIDIISSAWPGDAMTKVEDNIYSCTVPADAPNIIFNNGSTQTDDLTVPAESDGLNMYDFSTGKWSAYGEEAPSDEPTTNAPEEPEEGTAPDTTQPTESQPSGEQPTDNDSSPMVWVVVAIIAVAVIVVVVVLIVKKKNG